MKGFRIIRRLSATSIARSELMPKSDPPQPAQRACDREKCRSNSIGRGIHFGHALEREAGVPVVAALTDSYFHHQRSLAAHWFLRCEQFGWGHIGPSGDLESNVANAIQCGPGRNVRRVRAALERRYSTLVSESSTEQRRHNGGERTAV